MAERPEPPLRGDERSTLRTFLDFHRATLAMKCEKLSDLQQRTRSMPPSTLSLHVLKWGEDVSLRPVVLHLIHEYARHNGHADLLREGIDGVVEA